MGEVSVWDGFLVLIFFPKSLRLDCEVRFDCGRRRIDEKTNKPEIKNDEINSSKTSATLA